MKRATDPADFPVPRGTQDDSPPPPVVSAARNPRAYTLAAGKPLPIIWGTAKVGALLLETTTPSPFTPPAWVAYPTAGAYNYGSIVTNGGNVYWCSKSGVPAGSGGPTGTGTGIVDGTVHWDYVTGGGTLYYQDFVAALAEGFDDVNGGADTSGQLLFWDKEQFGSGRSFYKGVSGAVFLADGSQTTARGTGHEPTGYPHTILLFTDSGDIKGLPSSGTQRELPALAMELFTTRFGVTFGSGFDCSPADVVSDLLTHTRRGAGWISARIDASVTGAGASDFRTYCDCAGLLFSLMVDAQQSALEVVNGILNATNTIGYWYEGKICFRPLGDVALPAPASAYPTGFPVAGYGTTAYAPPRATFDFTTDHFMGSPPVQVTRRADADCFNSIPVQFYDRSQGYAQTTVEDPDQSDIAARGLWRGPAVSLPVIFDDGTPAIMLSRILAQRSLYVRNAYTWRCSWRAGVRRRLGELVTLTEPALGLSQKTVRITEISEDESETFTFTAEEYVQGSGSATAYTPQANDGYNPNSVATTSVI